LQQIFSPAEGESAAFRSGPPFPRPFTLKVGPAMTERSCFLLLFRRTAIFLSNLSSGQQQWRSIMYRYGK
jgi:hypothetical protein